MGLGLDEAQADAIAALGDPDLRPLRVAVEAQDQLSLLHPDGRLEWGELSGRMRAARAEDRLSRPAVGDFVAARPPPGDGRWRVEALLPRRTRFVRQASHRRLEPQVVAANVDLVVVVTSPNDDFEPRRLERYLTAIHASGAKPAVVLNKADLVADVGPWLEAARTVALDAPVLATSATDRAGLDQLTALLGPGTTVALVGSSGVGKSSLTNALLGEERQRVAAVRATDDKGRHTTTHRELLWLPAGPAGEDRGFLVDTPGMRALGLWTHPSALLDAFGDVASLAEGCRFRDCKHQSEPDCAVRAAVEDGSLSAGRRASFERLAQEAEEHAAKVAVRHRRSNRRRFER